MTSPRDPGAGRRGAAPLAMLDTLTATLLILTRGLIGQSAGPEMITLVISASTQGHPKPRAEVPGLRVATITANTIRFQNSRNSIW